MWAYHNEVTNLPPEPAHPPPAPPLIAMAPLLASPRCDTPAHTCTMMHDVKVKSQGRQRATDVCMSIVQSVGLKVTDSGCRERNG